MLHAQKIAGCVLLLVTAVFAVEKPWLEVRSPHFRVITDGSEREGRHVAGQFEFMRDVFTRRFPNFRFDPPEPLLILAPRDQYVARTLIPQMWKDGSMPIAGMFVPGWEKQYAIIRLDTIISERNDPNPYAVLYHECAHQFLHMNFRWLPVWLDVGLAEFYAYSRFEGDKMYIGAPPKSVARVELLDSRHPIALSDFIVRRKSLSRDQTDTQLFYSESWALTHFMTFGPGMEGGKKLNHFLNDLQRGIEQPQAFTDAFGKIEDVDREFQKYIRLFAFNTGVLSAPTNVAESSFSAHMLTPAETDAELAGFEMRLHNGDLIRKHTEAALKEDPHVALAHEDMGFVNFNDGKDEDAIREFSEAVALNGKMYISLFAKLMTSPLAKSPSPENRKLLRDGLNRVIEIKPEFAAAYVELAKIALVDGDLNKAFTFAHKAEQLAPFRAGYHLLAGEILRRMGHEREAATLALFVADRWGVPDHDEAMELWNRIPQISRGDLAPRAPNYIEDWKVAEGVVKSVTCHEHDFAITLDNAGQPRTFSGTQVGSGFSDTLWMGDHFNRCLHVDGLRGVVHYKPSDKPPGEILVNVSFRDDYPTAKPEPTK